MLFMIGVFKFFLFISSHHLGRTLQKLAKNSKDHADLYVFVTGKGNGNPLGIAYVGTVCSSSRNTRVSINRYGIPGKQKNKVLYTAEVKILSNS